MPEATSQVKVPSEASIREGLLVGQPVSEDGSVNKEMPTQGSWKSQVLL